MLLFFTPLCRLGNRFYSVERVCYIICMQDLCILIKEDMITVTGFLNSYFDLTQIYDTQL